VRPNASFQRRCWQASKLARLAARHDRQKSRPTQGPRQRRPLQSNVGPPWYRCNSARVKAIDLQIMNLESLRRDCVRTRHISLSPCLRASRIIPHPDALQSALSASATVDWQSALGDTFPIHYLKIYRYFIERRFTSSLCEKSPLYERPKVSRAKYKLCK